MKQKGTKRTLVSARNPFIGVMYAIDFLTVSVRTGASGTQTAGSALSRI